MLGSIAVGNGPPRIIGLSSPIGPVAEPDPPKEEFSDQIVQIHTSNDEVTVSPSEMQAWSLAIHLT
jgi:hypothetical protein